MNKQSLLEILLAALTGSAVAGVGTNTIRVELAQKSKTNQFESTEKTPVRCKATISKGLRTAINSAEHANLDDLGM